LKDTKQSERIRQVAACLFAEKGYNGVGVAEIGEATGLGRGALYHHIASKEELLFDISSKYIAELIEAGWKISASIPDPIERIRALSRHLMGVIATHLSEITVCFREVHALTGERHKIVSKLHADYEGIWRDAISAGVVRGDFRSVDRIAIKGLLGMYFYSFLWLKPKGRKSGDEVGDIFSDLTIRSLGSSSLLAALERTDGASAPGLTAKKRVAPLSCQTLIVRKRQLPQQLKPFNPRRL